MLEKLDVLLSNDYIDLDDINDVMGFNTIDLNNMKVLVKMNLLYSC